MKNSFAGKTIEAGGNFDSSVSSETKFHLVSMIVNRTYLSVCCFDMSRNYELIYFNQTAESLWKLDSKDLGLSLEKLAQTKLEKSISELVLLESVEQASGSSRKVWETKQGEEKVIRNHVDILPDVDGTKRYAILISRDITEKKQAQFKMEQLYSRYEKTVKNIPGMIYQFKMVSDNQYVFTFVSEKSHNIFGYYPDELINNAHLIFDNFHPEDREAALDFIGISAALLLPFKWEGRVITKTGDIKWILAESFPEKQENGAVVWDGIMIDLTDQKSLQKTLEEERVKLIQSSRLGELGKMAGGIAHEINNPIFAIRLSAENMVRALKSENVNLQYIKDSCQMIINVSDRVTAIVKGLRQFSRDGSQDPMVSTPIKQLFDDTLALCQQKFKSHGIDLRIPAVDPNLTIMCRPVQISQVMINLINNSYDAVKDKPEPWVALEFLDKPDQITIAVVDSGGGISPDVAAKIIQPFYTTKPVGEGTGLGLSISDSIIRNHHGQFWIDTESKNTRFCFTLPKQQH